MTAKLPHIQRLMIGVCLLTSAISGYTADDVAPKVDSARQYTFAWAFQPESAMAPRGGTSRGQAVELVTKPDALWQQLQAPGLTKKEKDRRAILAMSGPYRASFDFIETMGFTPGYSPPAPYQSWGTEYVYVIEDSPDFISLQHILVMIMQPQDGVPAEPIVVKHWRQDWRFENRDLFEFRGNNTWETRRLSRGDARGTWSQAVYQVDDSPRYASYGVWQHEPNFSTWRSAETWRPLPRREFSVRSDYHTLVGYNQHTITPTGWVHNEDNRKVVLSAVGEPGAVIAVEAGLNRYERITNHDWSAGDKYWEQTAGFWAQVRQQWRDKLQAGGRVTLDGKSGKESLMMQMFALASDYARASADDQDDAANKSANKIAETLAAHTVD